MYGSKQKTHSVMNQEGQDAFGSQQESANPQLTLLRGSRQTRMQPARDHSCQLAEVEKIS